MSLVGTRPPTVDEWKQYEPYHRGRLAVKPGLTGMWQVSGRSDITDFEEVVKLDMEYVKNWNIGMDAIQGFIPIWVGSEYVLGKDVLIAILATFYVTHAFDPTWMFCETMGLFKERKNAMVINAILNILLSVVLAKPFGMAGILGATAIARVLTIVWWEPYILFKKKFKRPLVDYIKQQAGIIGSNVLIVIFSYMLCSFVSESFMGLIVRIVISGLTVLLVELIFMRKTEEFAWAKNKLKQIIHR